MIPKYEQIKTDLLSEIKNHTFIPGDRFYSESDIKKEYNVSSITAVKALNELTSAGYLYRIQGKGTFVTKSKVSQSVKFSDIELHPLGEENVKVLSIEKGNSKDILNELGLTEDDIYYRICRLRFFGKTPYLLPITYLPKKFIKDTNFNNINDYSSIYDKIRKDFNIDFYSFSSVETNEIVFPNDSKITNLLKLSFREPAVKQIKHSYLPDGTVAEYIVSYKHWKYFKTKIEVNAV